MNFICLRASSFLRLTSCFLPGLAYLLKVLGQDNEFDSLGWFTSVNDHYMEEKRREMQMLTEARNDEKLEQASKLTAKRFQDYLSEFQLLYYSLSSARIFFHCDN
jgi:WASH complex subunit 7